MLTHMLPPRQLGVTWQHVTCVLITGPRSYINWTGAIITSGLWKATLHCVTSANWLHPPQAGNKCRPYSQLVGIRRVIEVRVELRDSSTVLPALCNLVSLTKKTLRTSQRGLWGPLESRSLDTLFLRRRAQFLFI